MRKWSSDRPGSRLTSTFSWESSGELTSGENENAPPRGRGGARGSRNESGYFRCFETSFVISNMLTWRFPPKTARSFSSALIMVRLVLS